MLLAVSERYRSDHFFLPLPLAAVTDVIDSASTSCPTQVVDAFKQNLRSTNDMLGLPFLLTAANLSSIRLRHEFQVRCIEAGVHTLPGEAQAEKEAAIHTALDAEAAGWPFPTEQSLRHLDGGTQTRTVAIAAAELRRQGLISMWGAFEVLAQDLFAEALNRDPSLVLRLQADDECRRFFDVKSFRFDALAEHGFDISKRMGTVLLKSKTLDTVPSMKLVFPVLSPDSAAVRAMLGARDLYLLNQRRNLIVHRRGIVDVEHARLAPEDGDVGTPLRLQADDLHAALCLVRDSGAVLLRSMAGCFAPMSA
jgi:hypothetical protein